MTSSVPDPKKNKATQLIKSPPEFIVPHLVALTEQIVHHTESIGKNNLRHRPLIQLCVVAKLDNAGRLWLMYADQMVLQQEVELGVGLDKPNHSLDCNAIGEDAGAALKLQCRSHLIRSHELK